MQDAGWLEWVAEDLLLQYRRDCALAAMAEAEELDRMFREQEQRERLIRGMKWAAMFVLPFWVGVAWVVMRWWR